LERETLQVMDDQQRIAIVESRTKGNDGSPWQVSRYRFGNYLGSAVLELDEAGQIILDREFGLICLGRDAGRGSADIGYQAYLHSHTA
jgi:hypothetical protein